MEIVQGQSSRDRLEPFGTFKMNYCEKIVGSDSLRRPDKVREVEMYRLLRR